MSSLLERADVAGWRCNFLHKRQSGEELDMKAGGQSFGFFTHGHGIESAKMEAATADDVVALLRN